MALGEPPVREVVSLNPFSVNLMVGFNIELLSNYIEELKD